jgi:plastocyanin domain-containing protein
MRAVVAALVLVACGSPAAPPEPPSDGHPRFEIEVGAAGYTPSEIHAPASTSIHLGFTRTSDEGCGGELVVPSMDLHRTLPLNERVWIDVVTPSTGRLAFTCGMGMYQGAIVVD